MWTAILKITAAISEAWLRYFRRADASEASKTERDKIHEIIHEHKEKELNAYLDDKLGGPRMRNEDIHKIQSDRERLRSESNKEGCDI